MPLHLLRDIPREIRDQIYAWVVASPFGCVCLKARQRQREWHDSAGVNIVPINTKTYMVMPTEPAIRLSFLRTCSQIHLEARNMLWRHNSLALLQGQSLYSHSRFLDPRFCYNVRKVHISIYLLGSRSEVPASVDDALRIFGQWARKGSLRSLTLTVVPEIQSDRGMTGLNKLLEVRKRGNPADLYFVYLRKLEEAASFLPAQLERKIVFDADWDAQPLILRRMWMKRRDFCPQELLKELHDNFGGELWVDGKLCFKDHVELVRLFGIPKRVQS